MTTVNATASEGAGINAVDYDTVNDRLLAQDRQRLLLFDVRPDHMKNGPDAIAVFGQPSFNDRYTTGAGPQRLGAISSTLMDEKNQRLFVSDARNNRVMVWDIHPDRLTKTPAAMMVLGQADFNGTAAHAGATGLKTPGDLYYDSATDRLFLSDSGNNRVLVFDARPGVLKTGAAASLVLGQADFDAAEPAVGATHMNNPGVLLHDPSHQRLFVGDRRNNRILVFDVDPARLQSGAAAKFVFGQDTFDGKAPRTNLKKASPELRYMKIDEKRQRLYATEAISLNRLMVFDVDPAHMRNNPDALSVIFQDSQDDIDVRVSQNQETWPRPDVMDFDRGILYSAASHPGGNRITMYDVSGDLPKAGLKAVDMLGHFDGDGNLDWTARAGAGRDGVLGRVFYPRSVALDAVDHRLFVGDQYNNRVLMYQLDRDNRIASREASIFFGQPDKYDVRIHPVSDHTMKLPYGFAYDPGEKRLFIGDGWHNRVLVFDADPKRLTNEPHAIAVLGQPDFTSENPNGTGPNRIAMSMMHPDSKSIGGGGPPAIAMDVDTKTNRLFMADSGNNRVLVFDVRPGQLKSGASAVHVLGQTNFTDNKPTVIPAELPAGTDPEPYKRGFNSPGGVAYDKVRDRLFVIDAQNSRVLVFKASPADLKDGMSAYAVIGQKDFISSTRVRLQPSRKPAGGVSEADGSRRFGLPSNLSYDPVKNWLYVTDRDNERTLVFDVDDKVLNTDQAAHMVLGKDDFVTDAVTIDEQEQIVEPRELAIDAEHQRLFQTDTPMGKVLVFDLPKNKQDLALPARGMSTYSTTDPWNGRTDVPGRDKRHEWNATVSASQTALPGASVVLTNTRQFTDPRSERRSRMLISETTLPAARAATETAFFVDQQAGDNILVVSNASGGAVNARIAFSTDGRRDPIVAERSIPAGGQVQVAVSELGDAAAGKGGVVRVTGSAPLAASMVRKIHTSRDEDLYVGMPAIEAFQQNGLFSNSDGGAIAGLKIGGGYDTELVLVNTGTSQASGHIELRDDITGEPAKVADVDSSIPWTLAPGAVFRTKLASSSKIEESVFAAIISDDGKNLPWSSAIVSQRDGNLLLNQTVTPGRPRTQLAWFALDTVPDLVRHGMNGSQMEYSVANPSTWPALVRFTLFDVDGNEKGRFEQIVAPGSQRHWSTADMFNVQQAKGSVRFWSDVQVALSARRVTTSLRGERVENELGYVDMSAPAAGGTLLLPTIWDGEGLASKIVVVNPGTDAIKGAIDFKPADGDTPGTIVLR